MGKEEMGMAGNYSGFCFYEKYGEFKRNCFPPPNLQMYCILYLYVHLNGYPVKNVTRILMEILRHFIPQIDGSLSSKLTQNFMTNPCHLSRYYLCSMLEHDMDFGQIQVMEFPWHLLRK